MSTIDVLILLSLIPLGPVLVTWWLPWERWFFKNLPQKILGPYLLYATFGAWHFKWELWLPYLVGVVGAGYCVAALVKKTRELNAKPHQLLVNALTFRVATSPNLSDFPTYQGRTGDVVDICS